jgi:hypothetical protein
MTEMVLSTQTLPETLFKLIRTERVKVREVYGDILLTPIKESNVNCPFYGMFSDGKISVDKFLASKQAEKELEL